MTVIHQRKCVFEYNIKCVILVKKMPCSLTKYKGENLFIWLIWDQEQYTVILVGKNHLNKTLTDGK